MIYAITLTLGILFVLYLLVWVLAAIVKRKKPEETKGNGIWRVDDGDGAVYDFTNTHSEPGEGPVKILDASGKLVRRCQSYGEARSWVVIATFRNATGKVMSFSIEDERVE